jgi:hypothetical protein
MNMKNGLIISAFFGAIVFAVAIPVCAQFSDTGIQSSGSGTKETSTISDAAQALAASAVKESKAIIPAFARQDLPRELSARSIFSPRENYALVIELARISWPISDSHESGRIGGRLSVGLNRPYYTLHDPIRVIGNFDFKFDGAFIGLRNSARVTVKYNLTRSLKGQKSEMDFLVDNIIFKVGIPFGDRAK